MECIVSGRHPRQNRATTSREIVSKSSGICAPLHQLEPSAPYDPRSKRGTSLSSKRATEKQQTAVTLSNVIFMDERISKTQPSRTGVRDRRYAIRFPFAADAELIDMESGTRAVGVTSDISLGGCFVCTSKPFPVSTRVRITLNRK